MEALSLPGSAMDAEDAEDDEEEEDLQEEDDENQHSHSMMMLGIEEVEDTRVPVALSTSATKKRAETWTNEEVQVMLGCRKEFAPHFNTCKSNKHLWEAISQRMRFHGYERSSTMCKDKWRNLLKDYRKLSVCQQSQVSSKIGFFKEFIEEVIGPQKVGQQIAQQQLQPQQPKFEEAGSSSQFLAKDFDRAALNIDQRLENECQTTLLSNDSPLANGMSPWNGLPPWNIPIERSQLLGRVIFIKGGDVTRKIGIDGTADAIKDVIKSVFSIRSSRAFWLEDEDGVVRSLDREMPLRTYNLCVDPGLTVKLCYFDGREPEEKTLFCDLDFYELLKCRGWQALREVGGYKDIDTMEQLRPMCAYQQGGFKDT